MWHHISVHMAFTPLELRTLKSSDSLPKWGREPARAEEQELAAGWKSKPGWVRGQRGCWGRRNMKEKILQSKFIGLFVVAVGFFSFWVKNKPCCCRTGCFYFAVDFIGKNTLFVRWGSSKEISLCKVCPYQQELFSHLCFCAFIGKPVVILLQKVSLLKDNF